MTIPTSCSGEMPLSALLGHVAIVVGPCAKEQVIGPEARRVVAAVENAQRVGYGAEDRFVDAAMDQR